MSINKQEKKTFPLFSRMRSGFAVLKSLVYFGDMSQSLTAYSAPWSCFISNRQMGAYHTLDLELNRKFTLAKKVWDVVALDRIGNYRRIRIPFRFPFLRMIIALSSSFDWYFFVSWTHDHHHRNQFWWIPHNSCIVTLQSLHSRSTPLSWLIQTSSDKQRSFIPVLLLHICCKKCEIRIPFHSQS